MNSFGSQCLHRYGCETLEFFHHPDRTVILALIQLGGFRQAKFRGDWLIFTVHIILINTD